MMFISNELLSEDYEPDLLFTHSSYIETFPFLSVFRFAILSTFLLRIIIHCGYSFNQSY